MKTIYLTRETQYEEEGDVLTEIEQPLALIVYNDDVNTFDHVIQTLIDVCRHDPVQAEQCTIIIHFKGKCDVAHGPFDKLRPMAEEILRRGITAKIEE